MTGEPRQSLGLPFAKGDHVVINGVGKPWDGSHGVICTFKYKQRPKGGKLPGWWAVVRCDPPKGLSLMECEIHTSHLSAESNIGKVIHK